MGLTRPYENMTDEHSGEYKTIRQTVSEQLDAAEVVAQDNIPDWGVPAGVSSSFETRHWTRTVGDDRRRPACVRHRRQMHCNNRQARHDSAGRDDGAR